MNRAYALPILIVIPFIIGIYTGFYCSAALIYGLLLAVFILFIFSFLRAQKLFLQDKVFTYTTVLMFFALGCCTTHIHNPYSNKTHYIHKDLDEPIPLKLKINQTLRSSPFQNNYSAAIEELNGAPAQGKILLSVAKDSLTKEVHEQDRIAVYSKLENIQPPLNPGQFDYAQFMANKGVLKRINTTPDKLLLLKKKADLFSESAIRLRIHLQEKLKASEFSKEQTNLMEALLLGQRSELSKETYNRFAKAGVVHVLAISGLHIGIILLFLMFLFKPLTLYLPGGHIIRSCLIIFLLWAYAYIAGLSPSILRAVTMFSFLSLGLLFKRRVFTVNMLCLSALVLLIYNPNFIHEIGFQLSYSAVLSIIIFQKAIYNLFHFKYKALEYIWQITSVTLSAQIGVLPLSLFYFHQLPGLFFLSNLLIIPFLGLILGGGFITLILLSIDYLPSFFATLYGFILDVLQTTINQVAAQDSFLMQHIYFSPLMLLFSVLCILFLALFLHRKNYSYLVLFLSFCILFQIDYIIDHKKLNQKQSFYVFHKPQYSVLGFQKGNNINIITDKAKESENVNLDFLDGLQNSVGNGKLKRSAPINNYYSFDMKRIVVIDSNALWQTPENAEPKTILLRQSPKINLARVLDTLSPKEIIADGSNYNYMVDLWRHSCAKKGISFHYTGKDGAFKTNY